MSAAGGDGAVPVRLDLAVPAAAGGGPAAVAVDEVRTSDVLVVGTGVAGLAAALGCSPRAVTVLTKSALGAGGSSAWAQGGVAVAWGRDDSPALHAADTLAVAGGLAEPERVELLAREGPQRIAELIRLGARFDRAGDASAELDLGREAAHSRRRIVHAGGDATGAELVRTLVAAVRRAPGVRVDEGVFAVDLVLAAAPRAAAAPRRVAGVLALDATGRRVLYLAGATVLATGGLGQLFRYTTNPGEVTADGLAMAARAGARLADVEMVQFHPTALAAADGDPVRLPLLTEALRGEGAILVDAAGRRFLAAEHPLAELAPRDVVARALHRRLAAGGRVFLDGRRAVGERFPDRFPTVFAAARDAGIDPRVERLPVAPAAHYHMGGVATDERGRSSLPGLWACGEVASTGVHGANRLASNSLLEALVFGARVAEDLAPRIAAVPGASATALGRLEVGGAAVRRAAGQRASEAPREGELLAAARRLRADLRRLAWARIGLVRAADGLRRAGVEMDRIEARLGRLLGAAGAGAGAGTPLRSLLESRNLLAAGRLIAAAAAARPESRGAHHREDFPREDPAWRRRLGVVVGPEGAVAVEAGGERPAVGGAAAVSLGRTRGGR